MSRLRRGPDLGAPDGADFRGLIPALNSRGGCFLFSPRHNGIRRSARPQHSNLRYRLLKGAGYANMYAREHWHIVLCGCVGGILPNLLDLAGQLIKQDLGKWYSDPADIFLALLAPFFAYLIYFGVGGFITMVFKETNPMKAVVLGVSAPALIAGWLSGGAPEAAPVRLGELFGVSTAYAEDHLRLPEDHHRVRVGFIIPERLEVKHGLKYKLIDQSGNALGFGTFEGPGETMLMVPANGSMLIYGDAVNPKTLSKLQSDEVYLLDLERNYWNDFKRAMGVRYKEPYDLTFQRVEKGT